MKTKKRAALLMASALGFVLAITLAWSAAPAGRGASGQLDLTLPAPGSRPGTPPDDQGLTEALQRDLGITPIEFREGGARAERATAVAKALAGTPGFVQVVLRGKDQGIVVLGSGAAVEAAAQQFGVAVEAPRPQAFASVDDLRDRFIAEVGADGLYQIAQTDTGWLLRVDDPERARANGQTPAGWAARFPGVRVDKGGASRASGDVIGGTSEWTNGVNCSTGFNLFSPDGGQGVMSAGHCGDLSGAGWSVPAGNSAAVSYRTWWQFGAPGSAVDSWGTDFATSNATANYGLPSLVSTYGGSVRITGSAGSFVGQNVCKSGRTTGWTCGTVTSIGWNWVVYGADDYNKPKRWVRSLMSTNLNLYYGDSGGPWVSGNKAVGISSAINTANGPTYAAGAIMDDFYAARPGWQLKLWLNQPQVDGVTMQDGDKGTASWQPGQWVSGRVPAEPGDSVSGGTRVRVTVSTSGWSTEVPVVNGGFAFQYQGPPTNSTTINVQAINGYSTSPTLLINSGHWPIWYKWGSIGARNGPLGAQTSPVVCGLRDGGCYQNFQGGAILWSPRSSAHISVGSIRQRYREMGFENSGLGYPTSDEVCGIRNGGCYQNFQGGAILWSPSTGAHENVGDIRAKYRDVGFEKSGLGLPTSNEVCGLRSGGCYQNFEGGAILWSPATGAHPSWGRSGNSMRRWDSRTAASASRPATRCVASRMAAATRSFRAG